MSDVLNMSDVPKMMHKPREVEVANGDVSGGAEEVQSFGSTEVPLDLHYPTTGVEQKSPWTWDNFWRMAPVTGSMMFMGGLGGAGRLSNAMWKFFQSLRGGKTPGPPPAVKVPGFQGQPIDERLELLLVDGQRHDVLAAFERSLLVRIVRAKAGQAPPETFVKYAENLMPLGRWSKTIENPVTHQPDTISISTEYSLDGIHMIVDGAKGTLIRKFELASLGNPIRREIELLTSYFRSEFKAPPVRTPLKPREKPVSPEPVGHSSAEPVGQGSATTMNEVQGEVKRMTVRSEGNRQAQEVLYMLENRPDGIFATAVGPEGREIVHMFPSSFQGKIEQIESELVRLYSQRFFSSH